MFVVIQHLPTAQEQTNVSQNVQLCHWLPLQEFHIVHTTSRPDQHLLEVLTALHLQLCHLWQQLIHQFYRQFDLRFLRCFHHCAKL